MEVKVYKCGEIDASRLDFAVISAVYKGKWVFVRHNARDTWEIPGGHRELNEDINITASRELYEETGALNYEIEPICDYSVIRGKVASFGRLFFAIITELGQLPESEIKEVKLMKAMPDNLTYPHIQPQLYSQGLSFLQKKLLK